MQRLSLYCEVDSIANADRTQQSAIASRARSDLARRSKRAPAVMHVLEHADIDHVRRSQASLTLIAHSRRSPSSLTLTYRHYHRSHRSLEPIAHIVRSSPSRWQEGDGTVLSGVEDPRHRLAEQFDTSDSERQGGRLFERMQRDRLRQGPCANIEHGVRATLLASTSRIVALPCSRSTSIERTIMSRPETECGRDASNPPILFSHAG